MAGKLHWVRPMLRQHVRSWRIPVSPSPKRRLTKALGLLAGLGISNGVAVMQAHAQCNTTATTTLSFTDANPARPTGENWNAHLPTGVPEPLGATIVSSSVLSGSNTTSSTLAIGSLNNAKTLAWTSDFSTTTGTVSVTFTFNRPLSNFTVNLADIDASRSGFLDPDPNFTDEVMVTGTNSTLAPGNTATPLTDISLALVSGAATNVFIAGNTATGLDDNNANTSVTVKASFASPITSLTLTYRSGPGLGNPDAQTIGIDQMTWCRLAPLATNVTTATVPSTATQAGISALASAVDGAVQSYLLTSLPTRGTLFYNTTGTTYTAITSIPAGGFVLTQAQANSLRYTPDGTFTGASTSFTYRVRDDANLTSANTATYTIPLQYFATCGTNPGSTTLGFGSRTAGEDWKSHVAEAVPAGSTATLISSGNYQNGAATTSTLQIGAVNSATLQWSNDFAAGSTKTSQVTFTFTRPMSNFTVQVQDIDAGGDFTDQVTFVGASGGSTVTPLLSAANPGAGITTISGNVATGQAPTSSPVDGTVTAYFSSPITSLTITYNNSSSINDGGIQYIGIDQMTWCRTLPSAVDVTSAALLNSIGTASISPLASQADNVPVTYTLTSIPSAATQGVLSYNSSGTAYTNITAAGQMLTTAQAASLRFTPVAGSSGNVTFAYKATDALGNLSTNTATYTIPVVNAPCTTATAELNFRTSTPVPDDWRAHAAVAVGGSLTTVSTSNYQAAAGATTSFSVVSGTATNNVNGVQSLSWATDYANQANNTSSVTFTFSRPVNNYTMRVQDIDRGEAANVAFIDQVTFVGANGSTTVLPALTAVGAANTVLINGNVATGTANVTNINDGTVVANFASPITSLTLTYRNTSTLATDPANNVIGIELMNLCRQAPVAADVTNAARPSGQGATATNPLSATAPDGTIASYTITALPPASQGTFYVNGVALTASTLTLTPAQAAQLSFAPAAGFSGNAGFSYTATDNAGAVSNTAAYTVPVVNTGAAGASAPCATAGKDGSPTISENPNTYYPSTATQSLAAGATSISVGVATVGGSTPTPTSIVKGDLLLVIQMQGADINSSNSDSYGDGVAGGGASGNLQNANFTAGTYEYVVASNPTAITATSGGNITLATPLVNSYVNAPATASAGPRRFQVVRVPQYANLTLGGTLAATPWNGSIGGIIVLDVAGQTSFSGNTITAAGRGFRGGGGRTQGTQNYDSPDYVNVSNTTTDLNAQKGEGTAGTPRYVNVPTTVNDATTNATVDSGADGYPGGTTSRGAPGNAGGGGNDDLNNAGGGGGANGGFGGRGGNSFSGNKAIGGEPGASFGLASSSRLVLGGGGGAGSTNNFTGSPGSGYASSGAAGGGIVMLRTGSISGTGTISANGGSANNSVADDGSGGGGAGGSILVTASSTASLSGLTLTANGGNGGTNTGGNSGTHGPGGGGGGGVILTNSAVASTAVAAGNNGTTSGGVAYGAAAGLGGISNTGISSSIANSVSGATCPADVATTITGPTSASAGQPTGNFTVTFTNLGGGLATNVTQTVTLPTGAGLSAAQQTAIKNAYPSATFTTTGSGTSTSTAINFGTLATLVSGTANASSYTFAYTAPATPGTVSTISNTNTASLDADPSNNTASVSTTVGAAADVTVALNGPTTLNAGQPTGNFTATFTNEGPSTAISVNRTVTLPAGATVTPTQLAIIQATYPSATYSSGTNVLNFGTLASLASDASSAVTFAFTAPTALGSSNLTGNTGAATAEGSNSAPNQTTLALTTVATSDVVAAITASSTATTGTFNVTFSNGGPQSAAGVVRTVQLPAGLTGSATPSTNPDGSSNNGVTVTGGGYYNATTGVVTYSPSPTTIAANGSLTSAISYRLASSATPVAATATVSTTTNEAGQTANNTFTALMPASFDLATTLTGPTTAIAGSPTTLYVTMTNSGPNDAPSATQTVIIPSALPLANVYITNGGTYTYNTTTKEGTVTFPSVANLPVGQAITNSISFSAPSSSFAPSAVVTVTSGDVNTSNNTAYLNGSPTSTQVAVTPATTNQSNETTTIVADKMIVSAGTVVTYTVTATNKGNLNTPATTNVAEQVQLLPGLTGTTLTVGGVTGTAVGNLIQYVTTAGTTTYDPATGVVTYPVLASQTSGTTHTFDKLAVTVPANTGNNGQLLATASVRTAQSDPTPADNTSSVVVKVQTPADLVATLTGATTATAGQAASYTATFVNRGTGSATNVQQTVQLPAGLTGVLVQDASGNVVNNAYNAATGLVTIPTLANMASGTSQVYGISFVAPAQSFPLTSSVSSGTTDPLANNNSALLRTTVNPAADVAVYVSGPATAVAGNAITYAVTTANNGPSPASNVQATLQLPANLADVTLTGGSTYDIQSGLVTFPSVGLAAGDSRVGLVTFTMPTNPTNGQIGGSASVTTSSNDLVASNNTAAITTDLAPATSDMADLATSITASATSAAAGSAISYTLNFRNQSTTTAATKVMPTAYLPTGLSNVVVTTVVNGATVVVPNAYNSATGQIVLPTIDSQAPGNLTQYTVSLTAPASASAVAISGSAVSSNTSDPTPSNNVSGSSVNITPSYDAVTSLAGPLTAQPGSINTYTVTTTNNGPSTAQNALTQTVTLPAGVTATNITGGTQTGNVITFTAVNNPVAGANGAVSRTFSIEMPATGSLPLTAAVTVGTANATPESNTGNNQATLTTTPANQAPVAQNVWNTLQSARGNTATSLLISPFNAADPENSSLTYKVATLPAPSQGVLYLANGSAVAPGQTVPVNGLYFAPNPNFVGNATFTYQAVDGALATSNEALYTIPVAQDQAATYAAYNSNKPTNTYVANDVLAQVVDANAAAYNSAGVIYNATSGLEQAGTSNGVASAVLSSGTLPAGTALRTSMISDATGNGTIWPAGEIYVVDPSLLPTLTEATTYTVQITVTDLNGGITTVPARFTLGASPLPVSLVAFTAQAVQNRDALLSWTTASELNNDRFEVERSFDGTSFVQVGQRKGQVTKATATDYTFTDAGIGARATSGQPVYYRLKQVDRNGTSTYSPVRSVSFTKAVASLVTLYPNPAVAATNLDLSALPAGNTYQVLLLDVTGRQVQAATLTGGQPQPLDLSNLATGTYHVVVTGTQADGSALRQTLRLTKE